MKKSILLLAIMAFCLNSFSQSTFSQTQLDEFAQKLKANPVEAVKKYTHKDFTFISGNGSRVGYNELVGNYSYNKETVRNLSDVKITQVNQTASVTGKVEHEWQAINDPTKVSKYKGMFTYIYVYDGGLWKIISAQHTDYQPSKTEDETAIRKVIKDETDGYYEANFDKVSAQWSDKASNEYQNQQLKMLLGKPYSKGEEQKKLTEMAKKVTQKMDVTVEESDYEVRQNGNMAWVTYNQKVASKDGKLNQNSRQTRILEKINGEWKIAFVAGIDLK